MGILKKYTGHLANGEPGLAAQCVADIYEYGPNEHHMPIEESVAMGPRVISALSSSILSIARMGTREAMQLKKLKKLEGKYKNEKVLEMKCRRDARAYCIRANIDGRDALVIVKISRVKGGVGKGMIKNDSKSAIELASQAESEIAKQKGAIQ